MAKKDFFSRIQKETANEEIGVLNGLPDLGADNLFAGINIDHQPSDELAKNRNNRAKIYEQFGKNKKKIRFFVKKTQGGAEDFYDEICEYRHKGCFVPNSGKKAQFVRTVIPKERNLIRVEYYFHDRNKKHFIKSHSVIYSFKKRRFKIYLRKDDENGQSTIRDASITLIKKKRNFANFYMYNCFFDDFYSKIDLAPEASEDVYKSYINATDYFYKQLIHLAFENDIISYEVKLKLFQLLRVTNKNNILHDGVNNLNTIVFGNISVDRNILVEVISNRFAQWILTNTEDIEEFYWQFLASGFHTSCHLNSRDINSILKSSRNVKCLSKSIFGCSTKAYKSHIMNLYYHGPSVIYCLKQYNNNSLRPLGFSITQTSAKNKISVFAQVSKKVHKYISPVAHDIYKKHEDFSIPCTKSSLYYLSLPYNFKNLVPSQYLICNFPDSLKRTLLAIYNPKKDKNSLGELEPYNGNFSLANRFSDRSMTRIFDAEKNSEITVVDPHASNVLNSNRSEEICQSWPILFKKVATHLTPNQRKDFFLNLLGDLPTHFMDSITLYFALPESLRPKNVSGFNDSFHDKVQDIYRRHHNIVYGARQEYEAKIFGIEDDGILPVSEKMEQVDGMELDNYNLRVPKTKEELSEIAYSLSNCVESYYWRIKRGDTNVFAVYKNDECVYCVEVLNDGIINQYYGYKNAVPNHKDLELLKSKRDFFSKLFKEEETSSAKKEALI